MYFNGNSNFNGNSSLSMVSVVKYRECRPFFPYFGDTRKSIQLLEKEKKRKKSSYSSVWNRGTFPVSPIG